MLTPHGKRRFWEVFTQHDVPGFKDLLIEMQAAILDPEFGLQERTRRIFLDALEFGVDHPDAILDGHSLFDTPNIVAFSEVADGIRRLFEGQEIRVVSFIHDEQTQFISALSEIYELKKKFRIEQHTLDLLPALQATDDFHCPLVEKKSHKSVGIQLIDVLLYIVRQSESKLDSFGRNTTSLLFWMKDHGIITEFSKQNMMEAIRTDYETISKIEMTKEMEESGRKIRDELDAERVRRIAQSKRIIEE